MKGKREASLEGSGPSGIYSSLGEIRSEWDEVWVEPGPGGVKMPREGEHIANICEHVLTNETTRNTSL